MTVILALDPFLLTATVEVANEAVAEAGDPVVETGFGLGYTSTERRRTASPDGSMVNFSGKASI